MSQTAPTLTFNPKGKAPSDAVAQLVELACDAKVSDLFFASEEEVVVVSVKHLGMIRRVGVFEDEGGRRAIAHIKAAAGMDIGERRRPHDGRWIFARANGDEVDLRVNTIPTLHGEDLTMRLLDRENRLLPLDALGFLPQDYNRLLQMLASPSGLILVTGPTRSGKTTTLYAILNHLRDGRRKINTIEDPVEYSIPGVRQSQVVPKIDVGFAELLTAVLRQAPDVIMIGEVRDPVTAQTAVRAANSGHLVLATLHAPVAAAAVQSMMGFDVNPHFLASSLLGVISQRLIRTLDPATKTMYEMGDVPQMFEDVKPWLEPGKPVRLCGPKAGTGVGGDGYSDRVGVFEMLSVSGAIRHLIANKVPAAGIHKKAVEDGMVEFRRAALIKVANGETSVEEVFRTIPPEYLTD